MKSFSSLALAAALLCQSAASDSLAPSKSLRGATSPSMSTGNEGEDCGRTLQQYPDQTCYQKSYPDGGMQVNEVPCGQIMGSCRNIESACDDTFADALRDATISEINSWYIYFNSGGQSGCQWTFTVCS